MKIKKVTRHPEKELIDSLRKVSLLHDATVFPYKNADIQLQYFKPTDIHPSQFYFLEDAVLNIGNLEKALREKGINLFQLDGFLEYESEDGTTYTLLPPIIEYQPDREGNIVPLLNDGIHRVLYAQRKEKQLIQAVVIKHKNGKYPLMGYPNPNGWSDVKKVEEVPESQDKRIWRVPVEQGYLLYRNFNSAFTGVGKPRQSSKK